LRCINNEDSTFTCGERAGDFVGEINVSRCINKIERVRLPVLCVVLHLDGVQFYRDTAFLLQIHIVQHLVDNEIALCDRAGLFEQAVRERGLSVVNVSDDAEISKLIH
jgi:hypothetical protein